MTDVMKYSVEAFAERMLLEGDLQGNRIVLQLLNQRTELLEALKKIADGDLYNATGMRWIAEEAIAKAEAAE